MKRFQGIIPPVLTPLNEKRQLDICGFEKLLERMIANGIHGVFIMGTIGEGPMLGSKIQRQLIDETLRIVRGRVPVLAGVSDAAFSNSVELAKYAKHAGADGIVAASPSYMKLADCELIDFFRELAVEAQMPLLIYNMPSMTKNYLSPQLVEKLSELPWISGCKDSSGNMSDFHDLLLRLGNKDDFSIFIGPEELISDAILAGADGAVTGGANVNPALFVNMFHAACNKDMAAVNELLPKIYHLRRLYSVVSTPNAIARGLKCAVKELGICEDFPVAPCRTFDDRQRAEVIRLLKEMSAELAMCR